MPTSFATASDGARIAYERSGMLLTWCKSMVEQADCFCALSPEAYARFKGFVAGTLVYDPDLVSLGGDAARRRLPVCTSRLAQRELGKPLLANAVFLGAASRVLESTLDRDRVLAALAERIPRFPAENRRGFELGWELGGSVTAER